ncbi:MAG: PAS domain S-box protein [Methanomassiliicoccales archaeon]|nr:MAG: PAS domain S-box protein [Methanomassiliicoccales archaeon]
MRALKKILSYLLLGQKGGHNRIQIIELLNDRPYNLNQLAEILNLNYRTVKHHMDVLLKNELISTSKTGGYGEVYFLTPDMEGNMEIFKDIIKKFEKSKKLKDFTSSPKFFQNVMEQTNDAVIIINKEGQVFFLNNSAEDMYGYEEEDIIGETLQVFPDSQTLQELIEKVSHGESIVGFETRLNQKSGVPIEVALTLDGIKDEEDNLIGFSILSRNITKRKQVETALIRSEERYALAQKAANIGSWDWNIITGDLFWSDTIEPMFGFSKGEFGATYEAFLESVHPNDREFVQDSVKLCVEESKEYAIEHRIVWPDGTIRWVSENGDVIRDENGKAIRMLGIVQDITLNKVAEDRIRYLNDLLIAIKDIGQIINYEFDLKGLLQGSCEKLLETRDYLDISIAMIDETKGKIITMGHSGKHERDTWEISPDGEGNAPECIKAALKSDSNQILNRNEGYCTNCKYCKHEEDHQTILIPMKYQDKVVGITIVCSDSEHEIDAEEINLLEELAEDLCFARSKIIAEEALKESEQKYRVAFNTSPDLFYRISPKGEILDCNDTAIKILGYTRSELIGMPLFNIYADESKTNAKKFFSEWQKTGKLRNKKLKIVTKDGQMLDVELNVNTIYDSDGNVVSSISAQRTIPENK